MAQSNVTKGKASDFSEAAKVEAIIGRQAAVAAAAAIRVPDDKVGEAVVCFVMLKPNEKPRETLKEALRMMVSEQAGEKLMPREVIFVQTLPRTADSNLMRHVVRSVYLGQDPGDMSRIENASVISELKNAMKYARIRAAISHFAESVVDDYEKKQKK